jgi:short-subunit dehydrogenase
MKRLNTGNVIVITGASTGIGRALAVDFAKKYKAKLVLNARSADGLAETAKMAEMEGAEVVTVCGDIGDRDVIENVAQQTRARFGTPDVLVNNAGFAIPGAMKSITVEDWRKVFEVNFFAPLQLTYAFMPEMLDKRKGMIVNIASVAGKVAFPGSVCYASTKFALTGFSEGMAAELGPKGIDVVTVCPGLVRTEFFRKNRNRHDVTAMAEEKSLYGWVLKNIASISSEEAAAQIMKACERGGCQEIVLTAPGVFLERMAGICPPAAWWLSRFVPADRGVPESIQR